MSLTFSDARQVLNSDQISKLEKLNKPVGDVRLHTLAALLSETLRLQDQESLIPPEGKFRSRFDPSMLDIPMEKFLSPIQFHPNSARLRTAINRVRKHLRNMGMVKPLSIEEAFESLRDAKGDRSAGLPTLGRKDEDHDALKRAKQCVAGKCPPPTVIAHRGKSTDIARPVHMFPFEWAIVEGAYFYPLQDRMKRSVLVYASESATQRRARMAGIIRTNEYTSKVCMDYSGYDGSVGTQLIGIAFQLLGEHIQFEGEMNEKLWSRVATYFATSPIVDQHLRLIEGRRGGVPSGSMFTQMIDTLVNAIIIEYMWFEQKKSYLVYGDDSWTLIKLDLSLMPKALEEAKRRAAELGIQVNLTKTDYGSPRDIMQFLGHYDLKPGRPAAEVYVRLIYPERPVKPTAENLRQRVLAYMAESDETIPVLFPIYRILSDMVRNKGKKITADVQSFVESGNYKLTTVESMRIAPSHLTGLAQYLAKNDPMLATAYYRIRAAV